MRSFGDTALGQFIGLCLLILTILFVCVTCHKQPASEVKTEARP